MVQTSFRLFQNSFKASTLNKNDPWPNKNQELTENFPIKIFQTASLSNPLLVFQNFSNARIVLQEISLKSNSSALQCNLNTRKKRRNFQQFSYLFNKLIIKFQSFLFLDCFNIRIEKRRKNLIKSWKLWWSFYVSINFFFVIWMGCLLKY